MISFDLKFKSHLDYDIGYTNTPDLPELRYHNAPLYVFLFDELRSAAKINKLFVDCKPKPFFSAQSFCRTAEKFYGGKSKDREAEYQYICSRVESFTKGQEKHPLTGSLYQVSLSCLVDLDRHYENTYTSIRKQTKVQRVSRNETIDCFIYLKNPSSVNSKSVKMEPLKIKDYTPMNKTRSTPLSYCSLTTNL
jgi:hypothetical protein